MSRTDEKKIPFRLESENPPARVMWIGVLQGTWREMGIQYGQRAAKDIRINFDIKWEKDVLRVTNEEWHKGRSKKERVKYCIPYLKRGYRELSFLSPETIEFMEGIAEGASVELNQSIYADVCSNFEKIGLLNFGDLRFHPGFTEECNGLWVTGGATKTGETFATRAAQSILIERGGSGRERQVAYVALPKDPNARVFWAEGRAGRIGGLGAGVLNDMGVCCLTAGAQHKEANMQMDETAAPGIRDFLLAFYGVVFSKNGREAAERITIGTPEYRALSGRKTVLRARGCNIIFADSKECYCVEQNALHYAIRTPGYLGEKGNEYLVIANHFKYKDGSYDENNIWHADQPMTGFDPEKEGSSSYYRFWSGMWMLRNNYGKIDREMMLREIAPSHIGYDQDGKQYDPDPVTGAPTVPGTFCDHTGKRTKAHALGTGGNVDTGVFVLNSLEVYWVPAWPCHYKDKNWNYLHLQPFSDYRKLLWGY